MIVGGANTQNKCGVFNSLIASLDVEKTSGLT